MVFETRNKGKKKPIEIQQRVQTRWEEAGVQREPCRLLRAHPGLPRAPGTSLPRTVTARVPLCEEQHLQLPLVPVRGRISPGQPQDVPVGSVIYIHSEPGKNSSYNLPSPSFPSSRLHNPQGWGSWRAIARCCRTPLPRAAIPFGWGNVSRALITRPAIYPAR